MDLGAAATAVAAFLATGAVEGLGEHGARSLIASIRERVRAVFAGDPNGISAVELAREDPTNQAKLGDLAAVLQSHAHRDDKFAMELIGWADIVTKNTVLQNVEAGRDAYTAGRDQTVNLQRPPDNPGRSGDR